MKAVFLLLIIPLLHVSASTYAQRITLQEKNASIELVFKKIKKQTGYSFLYEDGVLIEAKKVNLTIRNESLENTLDRLFADQPLTFNIKGKTIVVQPKEKYFVDKVIDYFSAIDVRGKVVDEQGLPLPGASVKVKGGTLGTVTGKDGDFFLKGVSEDAVIVIAYLGYNPLEVKANASLGVIKLELAIADLNEVVINKGYYNTTRELNTGSVSKVDSKIIGKQPVMNFLGGIAGRMAGVNIQQTSGIPGGDFKIEIRGRNSLRNDGNAPFYIVDGVPFSTEKISGRDNTAGIFSNGGVSPLMSINAADIESIEILKDADATAIYGSRGANGVVLITTKKSAVGKTKFDLNVYQGVGRATPLKLLNTQEYLDMRREALANDGYIASYPPEAYDINGTWDQNRYTDWQKVLIGSNANTTSLQGSISGGDERTQFLFTSGYRKETSVFPGDLGYQKGSFHLSVNHNSMNKRFTFSASFIGSADKNDQPSLDLTYEGRRLQPNAPSIHNSDGSLNWENSTWNNPFASLLNSYNGSVKNIVCNTVFGYEFLPGLKLKSSFGLNYIDLKEFNAYPSTAYNPAEGLTSARSEVRYSTGNTNSWIVEPQLSYDRKLGDHQLSLLLGVTYQDQRLEKVTTHYQNFPSNDLLHNLSSAAYINPYDFVKSIYKYNAVFGRINYNWDGKYIMNLTARRDGSSRFGPGHQFANFGAIGAAWLFYKDEFVNNNLPFLSFGKLRASYGVTGSDQIGNYQFLDTYAIPEGNNIYQGMAGLAPSRLYNPDFAWESNKKLEVAMELGFIDDHLLFNFAYYNNRSSNQLVDYSLPMTTGFTGVLSNLPATVQNTGIEAELNTINFRGRFNWTSSFNLTIPRNKLIAFPNIESSTYANTYVVGESIYIERLYEFNGVDPQMGIYTFRDFNGDGVITETDDRKKTIFVGQDFYGGVNNSFAFKGFTADVFLQFVKQSGRDAIATIVGGFLNQPAYLLKQTRWKKPGDIAEIQRLATSSNTAANDATLRYRLSEGSITDASFIRLKNVALSYQLPVKWIKKASCRLYIQGQNLFVVTPYKGYDPESSIGQLPPLKIITAGLQFTL